MKKEKSEALMRIPVGIVSGFILGIWAHLIALLVLINLIYTLIKGKPDKEIAEFCDVWKIQLKRYVEYMIFVNNNRTWPFGKFKDKKS
nr:hypothetical protein [Nanoarchaeum sp.]